MSTIEIKKYETYNFDELSEDAQENAYIFWQQYQQEWFWSDDAIASMKAFADHFDVTIKDYCIGDYGRNFVSFNMEDEISELSYVRLWKYLKNHGYENVKKYNQTIYADCPLTGYCADDDILEPMIKFMERPYNITFRELIQDCFDAWITSCMNDIAYQSSEENFKEYASNEKYLIDGTLFYK